MLAPGVIGLIIIGCIGPPLPVEPEELPNAVVGVVYRQQLTAGGHQPLRWTVEGELPPGLTLGSTTGVLAGTPADAGGFTFVVRVADAPLPLPREGWRTYTLTVLPRLELDATLPPARVGQPYSHKFAVTGGVPPYQAAVIGLPGGLGFDPPTLTIAGTPVSAYGALLLEVSVTDSGTPRQTLTRRLILTIKPAIVRITIDSLPAGTVGSAYNQTIRVADGLPPYTWAVVAGVLPDGLRLNTTTGVISGTPTTAQTAVFTVRVRDGDSPPSEATTEYALTIEP